MPRDRLTRRALFVSTAVALLAVSTGCLRSSIVRPAAGPISEPSLPVSPATASAPSQASSPIPPSTPGSTPASNPAIVVPPPLPVTPPNQNPSTQTPIKPSTPAAPIEAQAATSIQPAVAIPAAVSTPLLDAALERVEAMKHLEDDPLDSSATPTEPTDKSPTMVPSRSTPLGSRVSTNSAPIPIAIMARSAETPRSAEPTSKNNASETRPKTAIPPKEKNVEAPAEKPPPAAEVPAAILPLEELTPFGVSELHLCRKVHGFGSFETLNQTALKSGQRLLLYCEVTGLEYEPKDNGFLSRLSSRIEIKAADSGLLQWEQDLGSAEDLFGRRRRDYYVNYLIELPKSLLPGNYRLKLSQTDLVANRSTSAEISLQIVP
jgi:hypothetical protein